MERCSRDLQSKTKRESFEAIVIFCNDQCLLQEMLKLTVRFKNCLYFFLSKWMLVE